MKVYDEISGLELSSPDLTAGCLYTTRRVIEHVPESREVMEGTITEDDPKGLEHIIEAHDIYENCQFYHAYTDAEIAERNKPTLDDRITTVEAQATYTAMMTDTLMTEE